MVLDYIEGVPQVPGWYFINFRDNQVKAVLVHSVQLDDGSTRLYANIDIVALPVENMIVNAWAGPILLRPIELEKPEQLTEPEPSPDQEAEA